MLVVVLSILCGTLWLLDAGLFSCFVLLSVLLCLVDPVRYCDCFAGEERTGCFAFCWFLIFMLSAVGCLRFLLVSFVDYMLGLWHFMDSCFFFLNFLHTC